MPPKIPKKLTGSIRDHFKPGYWLYASSPHPIAKDAFASWVQSSQDASADTFGYLDFSTEAESERSPTGYAMCSSARPIVIHFKDPKQAKTWIQGQESVKAPFRFRELNDPTRVRVRQFDGETEADGAQQEQEWREELPNFIINGPDDFGALPQAFIRINTAEDGGITKSVASAWSVTLRKHKIRAFVNCEEKSIWVPVRTEADSEAVVSSYFPAHIAEFPGLLAEVVPIASGPNRTLAVTVVGTIKDREHHLIMMRLIKRLLGLQPRQTTADAQRQVRIVLHFEDTRFALRFLKIFDLQIETSYATWAVFKTNPIPLTIAATINLDTPPPTHTTPKRKREATPPSSPMPELKRRKPCDAIELSSSPSIRAKPVTHVIDLTSPSPTMAAAGPTPTGPKPANTKTKLTQAPVHPPPTETPTPATTKKTRAEVTAGAVDRANIRRQAKADSKAQNSEKANAPPAKGFTKTPKGDGGNTRPQAAKPQSSSVFGEVKLPLFDRGNIKPLSADEAEEARQEVDLYIRKWYNDHNCTIPSDEHIQEVLNHLPNSEEDSLAVFYWARRLKSSTMDIAIAFSHLMHHVKLNIGPDTPCVYLCTVNAHSDRFDGIIDPLPNVYGTERIRIKAAMQEIYQDLEKTGHSEDYIVSLLYAGYTWHLSRRGQLDALHYPYDGAPGFDKRSPLLLASVLGAGATGISTIGYIVWRNGEASLHGDMSIIADSEGNFKAFPPVTRIPIFSILDMPKHLWHILEPIAISLCRPNAPNVQLGGLARHRLDNAMVSRLHASQINPKSFTCDMLVWVFGTRVAGENTWRYLFDGSVPENVPFFFPFIATVLGRKRIVVLVPHIGVLNHVGHLPWILEAFANFTALSIWMGTQEINFTSQSSTADDPDAAEKLLALCKADPVYHFITARLQGPSLRNLWDGRVTRTVQFRLDAGEAWSNLYTTIMAELESEVITTLKMPSEDYEGFEEPILIKAVPEDGTGGPVSRKITVPDVVTQGVANVTSMHITYKFRPTDDTYVFFHIHPTTLHLQMITRDGEFPRNLATGKIFSVPRVEWMTKLGYAPEACEAHARAQSVWTKPSEIE